MYIYNIFLFLFAFIILYIYIYILSVSFIFSAFGFFLFSFVRLRSVRSFTINYKVNYRQHETPPMPPTIIYSVV